MIVYNRRINMVPGEVPVYIHMSQYDTDVVLQFELYASEGTFVVEQGTTALIRGTKPDGNGISLDAEIETEGGVTTVTVEVIQQMTAVAGKSSYELSLRYDGEELNTANFILDIERAPLDAETLPSESVIKELVDVTEQADEIIQAAEDILNAIDDTLTQEGKAADAKKVGDEITSIKQDLSDIQVANTNVFSGENIIDYTKVTAGKKIPVSTDTVVDADDQSISDYIPVIYGAEILLSFKLSSDNYGHAFYDVSKTRISCISGNSFGKKYLVPKDAAYLRLTIPNTELVSGSETAIAVIDTPWNQKYKNIIPITSSILTENNLIDYSAVIANKKLHVETGNIDDATNQSVSNLIPVVPGGLIVLNWLLASASFGYGFYDASKQYISGIAGSLAGSKFIIPPNTAYVRLTIPNDSLASGAETANAVLTSETKIDEKTNLAILRKTIPDIFEGNNLLDYTAITTGKRLRISDMAMVDGTNYSVSDYIPVISGCRLLINYDFPSTTSYGNVFYDLRKNAIDKVDANTVTAANKTINIPDGAYYIRLTIPNTYLESGAETAEIYWDNSPGFIVEKTKWLAVGDSITFGVYSYMGSNQQSGSAVTDYSWAKMLASEMNYEQTIMASRGMGYVMTGKDPLNPDGERIPLDTLLTRIEELTDDFNLITVAFGINDYNNDISIEDVIAGFDDAVSRLMAKWPSARLVIVTPFNSCLRGTAVDNFCYGTVYKGRTLKEISDAIQARCVKYGIECIYASNGFLLNNYNIETLLPDKVHPSLQCHKLIAKNMSHLLMF